MALRRLLVVVLVGTLHLAAITAEGQSPTPAEEADAFFQSGDWVRAAASYAEVVKRDPSIGRTWFRLGFSLHSIGKYEMAVRG
jgi:tetratricopeptide (TPR) repeat protein